MIYTVKGYGAFNKAEVDVFLELSCFFYDSVYVSNLISASSAFSKTNLNIWKFMVHILLKPGLENFEHYFTRVWHECNCVVVWAFFSIALLLDWNENWPFPALWPLLSFPNLLAYWVQHFHSIIFKDVSLWMYNKIQTKKVNNYINQRLILYSKFVYILLPSSYTIILHKIYNWNSYCAACCLQYWPRYISRYNCAQLV